MISEKDNESKQSQRIDKWLNISCLFKTRAKATRACEERRIKINNEVAKPSKMISPGDVVTIKTPKGKFVNLTVLKISHKNVSAKDAKEMYKIDELELSEEAKELIALYAQSIKYERPKYKGRPTKKERRKLDRIKGKGIF